MLEIDRWRTWRPASEKSGLSTGKALTKPTKPRSVSSVSSKIERTQNFSVKMGQQPPEAWAEDFHHWALDNCVYCDRWSNGIAALHRDFRDWCLNREEVPCELATFERLLVDAGSCWQTDW